jgi:Holliday junction resolvase-like predicted endonuclease
MSNWQNSEKEARNAIESRGLTVFDANVLFRVHCPNIDLVVFGKTKAVYIQVKSSEIPASKKDVTIDGSPWTHAQLYEGAPIFNRHSGPGDYEASLVVLVDRQKSSETNFYVAPPKVLEDLARERARAFAEVPKRDGSRRSIGFRKALSKEALAPWRDAWHLLD